MKKKDEFIVLTELLYYGDVNNRPHFTGESKCRILKSNILRYRKDNFDNTVVFLKEIIRKGKSEVNAKIYIKESPENLDEIFDIKF